MRSRVSTMFLGRLRGNRPEPTRDMQQVSQDQREEGGGESGNTYEVLLSDGRSSTFVRGQGPSRLAGVALAVVPSPRPATATATRVGAGAATLITRQPRPTTSSAVANAELMDYGPAKHPDYRCPDRRLASFVSSTDHASNPAWTGVTKPTAESMANAGFFYFGVGDMVRCFQCGCGCRGWNEKDVPLYMHVRTERHCPFVVRNLGEELVGEIRLAVAQSATVIKYPTMSRYAVRFATFQLPHNGPEIRTGQTPEALALAGFGRTGEDGSVRCFACGGGLTNWEFGDDPWTEHVRWFPTCPYLLNVKGVETIGTLRSANPGWANDEREPLQFPRPRGYADEGGSATTTNNRRRRQIRLRREQDEANGYQNSREAAIVRETDGIARFRDPFHRAILQQRRDFVVEAGYDPDDVRQAIHELVDRNTTNVPTELEIINKLTAVSGNKRRAEEFANLTNLSPREQNKMLKMTVLCRTCPNDCNYLFRPCNHLVYCTECGAGKTVGPKCDAVVNKTVRTYRS